MMRVMGKGGRIVHQCACCMLCCTVGCEAREARNCKLVALETGLNTRQGRQITLHQTRTPYKDTTHKHKTRTYDKDTKQRCQTGNRTRTQGKNTGQGHKTKTEEKGTRQQYKAKIPKKRTRCRNDTRAQCYKEANKDTNQGHPTKTQCFKTRTQDLDTREEHQ